MRKWEYEIRTINPTWLSEGGGVRSGTPSSLEIIEGYLNGMGEIGWELVCYLPNQGDTAGYAIFKKAVG